MHVSRPGEVLVVAHRGSSGVAPENTMAAFRRAADMGADMIELDVRLTRDAVPVVLHDRTLRRTAGARGRVRDTSVEELQGLDAGSWFAARYTGEHIPTLREVLDWLPPRVRINIELKTDGDRMRRQLLAERCLRDLQGTGAAPAALVSSFDHGLLALLHRMRPSLRLGILIHPVRDRGRRPSRLARRVGARAVICSASTLHRAAADDVRSHRLTLACYGVNSLPSLRRVLLRGVDAVITDHPDRVRAALGRETRS